MCGHHIQDSQGDVCICYGQHKSTTPSESLLETRVFLHYIHEAYIILIEHASKSYWSLPLHKIFSIRKNSKHILVEQNTLDLVYSSRV
jgi:hypothetical protein